MSGLIIITIIIILLVLFSRQKVNYKRKASVDRLIYINAYLSKIKENPGGQEHIDAVEDVLDKINPDASACIKIKSWSSLHSALIKSIDDIISSRKEFDCTELSRLLDMLAASPHIAESIGSSEIISAELNTPRELHSEIYNDKFGVINPCKNYFNTFHKIPPRDIQTVTCDEYKKIKRCISDKYDHLDDPSRFHKCMNGTVDPGSYVY